jgi:hypothetical protein
MIKTLIFPDTLSSPIIQYLSDQIIPDSRQLLQKSIRTSTHNSSHVFDQLKIYNTVINIYLHNSVNSSYLLGGFYPQNPKFSPEKHPKNIKKCIKLTPQICGSPPRTWSLELTLFTEFVDSLSWKIQCKKHIKIPEQFRLEYAQVPNQKVLQVQAANITFGVV